MSLPGSSFVSPTRDQALSPEERRQSGARKRARDRLMDRAVRDYPESQVLSQVNNIQNLLLFIDDDLRETGLALGNVERYLVQVLELLEAPSIAREQVHAIASDTIVLDHIDMLTETIENLRRRLTRLASNLR